MAIRDRVVFYVNHSRVEVGGTDVFQMLAGFLRYSLLLTGTKIVCAEGDCGSCTVLVKRVSTASSSPSYYSVNSCITPIYLLDGCHIITVEGIQKGETLAPIQEAMIASQGAQCGYCTPGFICSLAGYVDHVVNEKKEHRRKRAANFLTGNLCRCTGYQPILDAVDQLDWKNIRENQQTLHQRYNDPGRDQELRELCQKPLEVQTKDRKVFLPVELQEALELKAQNPDLRVVSGATDFGVFVNKDKISHGPVISLQNIPELSKTPDLHFDGAVAREPNGYLRVGACVTLSVLEKELETHFSELARLLRIFASPQIKNQGTLVGNVLNGSPIGDTLPCLMISDARIQVASIRGKREIPFSQFYLGYRKTVLESDEIVTSICIPLPSSDANVKLYKVSMRKDLDISAVTFAGLVELEKGQDEIRDIRVSYGGVGPTVQRLAPLEKNLRGKKMVRKTFEAAAIQMGEWVHPVSDLRGSREYRLLLCRNLFLKFYDEVVGARPAQG